MDVKSAFLNGILQEEVYVKQPQGFEDPQFPNHVYKLKKDLYGLKGNVDNTVFIRYFTEGIFVAQIYVDAIIFGSTCASEIPKFVDLMTSEFEMSLIGDLTYFLGLQIKQLETGIFISQSKYTRNMLEKFGIGNSKHAHTPIGTTTKLTKDETEESVDPTLYRSMIGSILYLTTSHPDISFSVGLCARYQANPKQSHLTVVKRIFKYLGETIDLGLWYSCDTTMSLVGYSDSDWAGSVDDRKSTSGGCFFVGNNLVSWLSKKQNYISLFAAEAEYIAAGSCCTQLIWLNKMLTGYVFSQDSLVLFCDSTNAINMSKNPVQHSRTKHIDNSYGFWFIDLVGVHPSLAHLDKDLQPSSSQLKRLPYLDAMERAAFH
ncbi:uncharacterized mitochondrial protein AtMg00810-like [Humulus lupulus]|uniref:uncharacterized mitochondrial protein AtMg00810-like n=1 Tax=Humulus lupulus TaxID=3486 RepID=UPI002B408D94|nr:uncharacterized mitochondrial protein AtMg00810-like [Humulus lupulus]